MATRPADHIAANFQYFQTILVGLLRDHFGEFAVLSDSSVVGVYRTLREAVDAGYGRSEAGRFSVQRIIDRPLDLGFHAYAADDGIVA